MEEKKKKIVLGLGNTFSGGLFFGLGLVHLLPESSSILTELLKNIRLPIAFLVSSGGFFLMWMIEKVIFNKEEKNTEEKTLNQINLEEKSSEDQENYIEMNELEKKNDSSNDLLESLHQHHEEETEGATTEDQNHSHSHFKFDSGNKLGSLLLLFILSLHSLVEGITLGITRDLAKLTPILIAIISHKWADALAFGNNL